MTPVQERLLNQLSDGELHSGTALGDSLAVSRAAVWKQIQALQSIGVEIQSENRHGYRLSAPVIFLDGQEISSKLSAEARQCLSGIERVWSCDSTNSELMRRLHDGTGSGVVLVAEHQTAGRGRRGKEWISPFGGSLYLSLLWSFSGGPMTLSGLGIVAGIAVAKAVNNHWLSGVRLKWPNDIYFQNRKLGGILIDLEGESEGPTNVVIGIGLNVDVSQYASSRIEQPWTSLAEQLDVVPSRNEVAASILNEMVLLLELFEQRGLKSLMPEWEQLDLVRDHTVLLEMEGKTVTGVAKGIDHMGALQVESGGEVRRYFSGDLSLRLNRELP